ncbi:MAG: RnfABCDGE type electron transport complex subunit G [Lachnospiraceae bacterium]|nr:RnfABCDGE type electron transport complex subunit G [Lachnospiraceae bacterium]
MKQIIKDALILFAITAVAGILLALVNEITKEPIAAQEQQKKTEAFQAVFADAATFETMTLPDMTAPEYAPFAEAHPLSEINEINTAYDAAGQPVGYVLTVTNKEGYGGNIQFVMGIRMGGTLNGISILETSETVGLGLEAQTVLAPQFAGKNVTSFAYTKTGAMAESEVDAISSATITTNAVVNGVNAGLDYFHGYLMEGGMSNE